MRVWQQISKRKQKKKTLTLGEIGMKNLRQSYKTNYKKTDLYSAQFASRVELYIVFL